MKLFKLIFMVRFIKVLEWISSIKEAATLRSVPMRAEKDTQKINKDWLQLGRRAKGYHKVNTSLDIFSYVN